MKNYFIRLHSNKKLLGYSIILLSILFLFSTCKKNQLESSNESVLSYIKSLGFKDSDIKDVGSAYLVAGDIRFSKSDTIKSGVKQTGCGSYINSSISKVLIYVDPYTSTGLPAATNYLDDLDYAIYLWNSVANIRISFSRTVISTDSYTTRMVASFSNSDGDFPVNGMPGKTINLDTRTLQGYTAEQRRRTIAHEIGHIVGLMHPNDPLGILISGTPEADSGSIMGAGTTATLSSYDQLAFYYLYHLPFSISGPSVVCSNATYTVANLPSNVSVAWSAPSSADPYFWLYPSGNNLTVISHGSTKSSTTLIATVTVGSLPSSTCTFAISNDFPVMNAPFTQSACTAYYNYGYSASHPALSGTVSNNSTTYVYPGCSVAVYLQLPYTKKVVLGSGGVPLIWSNSGPYLFFTLPSLSQGVSFIFNIVSTTNDGSCPSQLIFKTLSDY